MQVDDTLIKQLCGDIKTIKEILTGNGDPSKGIVLRLDRVETKQKLSWWLGSVVLVGLVTAAANLVPMLFHK